jgi:hypothetical protein
MKTVLVFINYFFKNSESWSLIGIRFETVLSVLPLGQFYPSPGHLLNCYSCMTGFYKGVPCCNIIHYMLKDNVGE